MSVLARSRAGGARGGPPPRSAPTSRDAPGGRGGRRSSRPRQGGARRSGRRRSSRASSPKSSARARELGNQRVTVDPARPPAGGGAGDRVQLQQVLVNLMINGIDAMPPSRWPRVLRVRVEATLRRTAGRGHDSGVGVDPGRRARLRAVLQHEGDRMGMGLAISRSIIEAHGGRLWAGSPGRGQGARFAFTLPVAGARGAS